MSFYLFRYLEMNLIDLSKARIGIYNFTSEKGKNI